MAIKKTKIYYLIPTYRRQLTLDTAMMMCRDTKWAGESGKYELHLVGKMGIGVHFHRNSAVKEAKEQGCRYLFMTDADCYAPGSAVKQLLTTMKKYKAVAVGAAIVCRTGKLNCRAINLGTTMRGWVGTGMILIDVKKLTDAIPKGPWFKFRENEEGTGMERGEDFHFCELCDAHGLVTVVDATLPTGHHSEKELLYNPDTGIGETGCVYQNRKKK